ncbi:PTS sugar transporter subunit IIB [Sporolactobacillus terrae]|uniref:PTS lactose transporter subunit IIB n=1 Tax=Sporolactobacillus terrae TaxID=269673 RepID=A0A410D6E5_9BACL|nr:PTS sugar transporter subunit IIB [Sporolactobacillus terrae]QAA21693.1 PTS lactose transporter subunit IIB [Sporolactobacillus terrae]QAA24665.1 PTS lactose transporter subunit IIB [Sporolactobacillus terrae]UAK16500.1 PTS sugar transporter subunit IIB [Sporolactobacillus terrae]BBN97959.1 PTS lactose transporter subunit IIB [Sporolactobacillus terrae]
MKIAAVCGSGLGSSFMIELNIKTILNQLGISEDVLEVTHFDMGSATSGSADHFFVGQDLAEAAEKLGKEKVTVLNSIIDKAELKEKVTQFLKDQHLLP